MSSNFLAPTSSELERDWGLVLDDEWSTDVAGGDCHIYSNHAEQVELQLSRAPYPYPMLELVRKPESIFDYRYEDFVVHDYRHHPPIKAPVAV